MYAQITTLQVLPDRVDDAITHYRDCIIPLVQQQPGCRLITLLSDPEQHQVLAICWWASEAYLRAGCADATYQQHIAHFASFLRATPTSCAYQVDVQVAPI
jgi:quinol monooxygenase YgiN